MKYLAQSLLLLVAVVVLASLQYQYWFGGRGHDARNALQQQIKEKETLIEEQHSKNRILVADVKDLKTGLEAVEEHARLDLGLIKPYETFVQFSTADVPVTNPNHDVLKTQLPIEDAIEPIPEGIN